MKNMKKFSLFFAMLMAICIIANVNVFASEVENDIENDTSYFYTNESGELIQSGDYELDEDSVLIEDLEDYEDLYNNALDNQDAYKEGFETQRAEFLKTNEDTEIKKFVVTDVLTDIKSEYTTDYYYYYLIKYQNIKIKTEDGKTQEAVAILSYDVSDNKNIKPLKTGDTVYGYVNIAASDSEEYNIVKHGLTSSEIAYVSITEPDRSLGLILLTILAALLLLLYAGKHGAKILIPIFVAIDLLFIVLVPQIELGTNIYLMASLIALELIILIACLKNGWSRKTLVSIISSIIVVVLVASLGLLFAETNRLTGKGLISEENYDLSKNLYYIDQTMKTTVDTSALYIAAIILISSVVTALVSSKVVNLAERYAGTKEMVNNIIEEAKEMLYEAPLVLTITFFVMSLPQYMVLLYNKTTFNQLINSETLVTNLSILLISIISSLIISPITAIISNLLMGDVEIKQIESK